jgi:Flp pilus assembly pilin Flp
MESQALTGGIVASQRRTVLFCPDAHGVSRLRKRQPGQSTAEYALILARVAVVELPTWALLGSNITTTIQGIVNCL